MFVVYGKVTTDAAYDIIAVSLCNKKKRNVVDKRKTPKNYTPSWEKLRESC